MKKWSLWGGFVVALALLILTITNASYIAPYPAGAPKQIAHRALAPELAAAATGACPSAQIEQPYHRHLPNTRASVLRADRMGGWLIEVDAQRTSDGDIVLLADSDLDCLTDGTGPVAGKTVDELQALDPGYGYSADGGASYPLRGKGAQIPTLGEIARAIPAQARLMVHLAEADPAIADGVARALKAIGRDPQETGDAFYGSAPAIARIRELYPDAWAFTAQEARQCAAEYTTTGWLGIVPQSCEAGTMLIALDEQALLWGWPNRLIARMEAAGAKILIEGPGGGDSGEIAGITLPEQLTQIPSSFNGYVWTDDAFNTLPALIPRFDNRNGEEIEASKAVLERRRKGQ